MDLEASMVHFLRAAGFGALTLLLPLAAQGTKAQIKSDFKEAGQDIGKAGKKIAHAAKKGGKKVGRVAKDSGKAIGKGGKAIGLGVAKGAKEATRGVKKAFKND